MSMTIAPPEQQSFHHPLPFGAELRSGRGASFRIWAPTVDDLKLRIAGQILPMQREAGGWFAAEADAAPGVEYCFVMPDGLTVPDPASRMQLEDVHGPSILLDPNAYVWRHPEWRGRPWHETVIYECHAGIMGGFSGIEARLPELAALGVTAIELMPLSDVPGPRNWGYDGVLPFAPDRAFGTPDQLKSMIDAAHGLGLQVFLDVVYNHFGPDGAYIHAYAKSFFRDDLHTPWGAAIDFRRPEVRGYFIQNAIYWIKEYQFDGLRLDAVHEISEEDFLTDLAAAVRKSAEGRHVHLVLEHENNRSALLDGPPQFDGQWADDMHHCLHVLLTGEAEGYYEDFQDATGLLVKCLSDGFAYTGQMAPHLGRPRGEPSKHLATTAFVICLQNHDQTGNRAMGERLTVLADPAALRAATAFLLLSPFIPMLFMGEEHASTTPFLFFTSHNEELARLVDAGRRNEFKGFNAFQDPARRARIPSPNDPATFQMSVPARTDPNRHDWIASLLRLRHETIVPGLVGARNISATALAPGAVQAEWELGNGKVLTILLNLGETEVEPTPSDRRALFATPGANAARLPPASTVVLIS